MSAIHDWHSTDICWLTKCMSTYVYFQVRDLKSMMAFQIAFSLLRQFSNNPHKVSQQLIPWFRIEGFFYYVSFHQSMFCGLVSLFYCELNWEALVGIFYSVIAYCTVIIIFNEGRVSLSQCYYKIYPDKIFFHCIK